MVSARKNPERTDCVLLVRQAAITATASFSGNPKWQEAV
jgi:hypothetical protein